MASRLSSDEGEISDSYTDKATRATSSKTRSSVNAKLRAALSPSPEPYGRPSRESPPRRRDRSPSPSRGHYGRRREKRRREHELGLHERFQRDQKRPRPYQEEDRSRHPGGPHAHVDDAARGGWNGRRLDYDDHRNDRDVPLHKRQRTRSRSPPGYDHRRRGGDHRDDERRSRRDSDASSRAGSYKGVDGGGDRQALRPRQYEPNVSGQYSRGEADHAYGAKKNPDGRAAEVKHPRFAERDSTGRALTAAKEAELELPAPVDEDAALEERRRRREAIKAKHGKIAQSPLLVQALESGALNAAGPQNGFDTPKSEGSLSPSTSAPLTPGPDSVGNSPPTLAIDDDSELANGRANGGPNGQADGVAAADAESPSAADYDPTLDMEEDRVRGDLRRNNQDLTASTAYDEVKGEKKAVLLPDSAPAIVEEALVAAPAEASKGGGDDMFASDDEDDMFAPAAPKGAKVDAQGDVDMLAAPVAALAKPKELDISLLDNWDDHEGYYKIILGELLDGRYHIQANLGKGMFSSVVRATDTTTDTLKAIKVIRNNETMTKAAAKEMEILQKLADADPDDKKHMVRLERSFVHKGHLCLVFEHLSINLREVLKKFGRDVGINLKAVRSYAQQIFLGLSLLRKCNIVHADLKPDNILVNEARNMLKICDLGSAADADESDITPYLVSRFYRAPEVILGIPFDFGIDMWSIGCTLFELYTGKILFTGRTNNQMLRSMMECRGKFSLKMLKRAEFGAVHFDDGNLNFRSMERDKITGKDVTRLINFVKPTRDLKSRLMATAASAGGKLIPEADLKELNLFADLLDRCLALNPEKRLTPLEALKHPFIYRGSASGTLFPPVKR